MTKFIYDIKSIMCEAWETARELCDYRKDKYPTAKAAFPVALRRTWARAQGAMEEAIEREKLNASALRANRRYIELLEIAERDGLNHGKSWVLNKDSGHDFAGQEVCYVYPTAK